MAWFVADITRLETAISQCERLVVPGLMIMGSDRLVGLYLQPFLPQVISITKSVIQRTTSESLSKQEKFDLIRPNFAKVKHCVVFFKRFSPSFVFRVDAADESMHDLGRDLISSLSYADYAKTINVAAIFKRFVSGITLFDQHQNVGWPVYHRDQSCGPKVDAVEQEEYISQYMNCAGTVDVDNLHEMRARVWNCYLERQIFDNMYKRYVGPQNLGHMYEAVGKMRSLFQSCFGESASLTATLSYDETNNVPLFVTVLYASPETHSTYSFVRNAVARLENVHVPNKPQQFVTLPVYGNGGDVMCQRTSRDFLNRVETISTKTQNVSGERPWNVFLERQITGGGSRTEEKVYMFVGGAAKKRVEAKWDTRSCQFVPAKEFA